MASTEQEIAEQMGEDVDAPADDDANPDDEGTLTHPEGELVTPPPAPPSQAEIEARQEKLEREADRHAKRVAEIMGDDFGELIPNPCDWTPGYLVNPALAPIPPDVLAAFDEIVGRGDRAALLEATDAQACDACNALGQVLTGSKVPGQETKPCGSCQGSGWRHKMSAAPPAPTYDFSQNAGAAQPPPPNVVQVADAYGRPVGHPHYGMNPAAIGV